MCEEFPGLLPMEAVEMVGLDPPDGPLGEFEMQVMDARAYGAAKAAYDRAPSGRDRPQGPLIDRVIAMDFEIARERIEQRRQQHDETT